MPPLAYLWERRGLHSSYPTSSRSGVNLVWPQRHQRRRGTRRGSYRECLLGTCWVCRAARMYVT